MFDYLLTDNQRNLKQEYWKKKSFATIRNMEFDAIEANAKDEKKL